MMINNILIIEPFSAGHRLPYVAWITKGLIENGMSVTLVLNSDGLSHPVINSLNFCLDKLNIESLDKYNLVDEINRSAKGNIINQFSYWKIFKKIYLNVKKYQNINLVFIPYLDYILKPTALLGSPFGGTTWSGIVMRVFFHHQKIGISSESKHDFLMDFIFKNNLKIKSLDKIFTIDESFETYAKKAYKKNKIKLIDEPIGFKSLPDSEFSKDKFLIAKDKKIILIYGGLSSRKGIVELLEASMNKSFPRNIVLIFAGKIHEDILRKFDEKKIKDKVNSKKIILINKFIDEELEQELFAAADYIWAGYKKHFGPSGILIQAQSCGKPIIVMDEGYIGWKVKKNNLGVILKNLTPNEIINAINDISLINFNNHQGEYSEKFYSYKKATEDIVQNIKELECLI